MDLNTLSMTEIVRLQNQLQQELVRRFERRLLMVFSDIVGSTPYFARFGDAAGRQLHQLHHDSVAASFAAHGGRLVDAVGDGAFGVFAEAEAGVAGVIAFHEALARANAGRERAHQLAVRVGLHWGPVLTDGDAVTGDAVHVAARAAREAAPGAVVLTRSVFQELGPRQRLMCRLLGARSLKGLPEPVELLALDWRDPEAFPRRVQVEETGELLELPQQDIVGFGRLQEHEGARANDVVLVHPDPERTRSVSRWHFELRRVAQGLQLHVLSDSETLLDDERLERGAERPVKSGSRIRVGGALTLRLCCVARAEADEGRASTMLIRR